MDKEDLIMELLGYEKRIYYDYVINGMVYYKYTK
jgi:hypothetical protein